MYIEQIYTKCLAEASYYIESNGYAAVIDPLRDVEPYLNLAKRRGAKTTYVLLDVRRAKEFDQGHLSKALNIPLDYIAERKMNVPKDKTVYVYCAAGYRSMAFISILRKEGYRNLIDINGGYKAIKNCGNYAGLFNDSLELEPGATFCDISKRQKNEKL